MMLMTDLICPLCVRDDDDDDDNDDGEKSLAY